MADHFLRATAPASPVRTGALLRAIAQHLTEHRPAAVMTEAARLTVVLGIAGTAEAARPLLRVLPFPILGITRGEYALHVRKIAWAHGAPTADSDPDMDEALRRARRAPAQQTFEDGDDRCPMCDHWTCTCGNPTGSTTRTLAVAR